MNTNEQAPDSCPFCGAVFKGSTEDGVDREYRCGTWVASEILSPQRTLRCITAERERLTRERDGARTLAARRGEVLEKLVSKASASLASAGIQEGELSDRIEWVCAIKKQLESEWAGWPELQREWFGDKYAAMQPLEAVRARIEDTEARIKGIDV